MPHDIPIELPPRGGLLLLLAVVAGALFVAWLWGCQRYVPPPIVDGNIDPSIIGKCIVTESGQYWCADKDGVLRPKTEMRDGGDAELDLSTDNSARPIEFNMRDKLPPGQYQIICQDAKHRWSHLFRMVIHANHPVETSDLTLPFGATYCLGLYDPTGTQQGTASTAKSRRSGGTLTKGGDSVHTGYPSPAPPVDMSNNQDKHGIRIFRAGKQECFLALSQGQVFCAGEDGVFRPVSK